MAIISLLILVPNCKPCIWSECSYNLSGKIILAQGILRENTGNFILQFVWEPWIAPSCYIENVSNHAEETANVEEVCLLHRIMQMWKWMCKQQWLLSEDLLPKLEHKDVDT